jgi:gamma-glutamyltranspeptidase/glutathione hydrolase
LVSALALLLAASCRWAPSDPSDLDVGVERIQGRSGVAWLLGKDKDLVAPETYGVFSPKPEARGRRHMVVAPHPLASELALEVLRGGGNALDAAIAAQVLLTLVEPQASGLGGGGFLLYYDSRSRRVAAFDGREYAPAAASPAQFLGKDGRPMEFYEAVVGGKSVGVPGLVVLLEQAHRRLGHRAWAGLLEPTARLAERGFPVSARLSAQIAADPYLRANPAARAYFYDQGGRAWPEGHRLVNRELAGTVRAVAAGGSRAFYQGRIADDIVEAVNRVAGSGYFALADLREYRAVEREPLCGPYGRYIVCGMPPPSAGGLMTLQALGILARLGPSVSGGMTGDAVHLLSEATKLAFADRNAYVADPEFVPVDVAGLLAADYLDWRAGLVDPRMAKPAEAGKLAGGGSSRYVRYDQYEPVATSHISVVDRWGNAASLTASVENLFGSRIFVRGFLLNNQLTDFAFEPVAKGGRVANAVAPRKRPRSSMSPTLVFEAGAPRYVLGSPGGSYIGAYLAQTLAGVLDWGQSLREAVEAGRFAARVEPVEVEKGRFPPGIAAALRAKGHGVREAVLTSGVAAVEVGRDGALVGVADPRREGLALGD